MDCKEMHGLISEYLDDTLPVEQKKNMEAHLDQCDSCRRELAFHRQIQGALQGLGRETITAPAGFLDKVSAALQREAQKPRRKFVLLPAAWHKGVAAAAIFLLIVGNTVYFNDGVRTALGDMISGSTGQSTLVTIQPDGQVNLPEDPLGATIEPVSENPPDDPGLVPTDNNRPEGQPGDITANQASGEQTVTSQPTDPVGPSGQEAPTQEQHVLLADELIATSTYLRIATADLNVGKVQAEAIAVGAGAVVQTYPAQQETDGKKAVLIKITVPVGQAKGLIADLSNLGKVQKLQDDQQNLSASYKETQVYYNDLTARLAKETNVAERQRLEAQIAAYKQQLTAWNEQIDQQTISLWLESQ